MSRAIKRPRTEERERRGDMRVGLRGGGSGEPPAKAMADGGDIQV